MDIKNFDEAIPEIVKYMEYPVATVENTTTQQYVVQTETDDLKKAFFIRFYEFAVSEM